MKFYIKPTAFFHGLNASPSVMKKSEMFSQP